MFKSIKAKKPVQDRTFGRNSTNPENDSRAGIPDNRSGADAHLAMEKAINQSRSQARAPQATQLRLKKPAPGQYRQLKRIDPWAEGGSRDCRIWLPASNALGKAYTKTIPDKTNRNQAMGATGELIAQTPGKNGVPAGMTGPSRSQWVEDGNDLNKDLVKKVDPFCIDFKTKYDRPSSSTSTTKVEMETTVHFGTKFQGYVVAQKEGAHASQIESGAGSGTVFGTEHVDTGTSTLAAVADQTQPSSAEPTKEAWEVRTSIMGEGARFIPIREMNTAGTLKKDTRFYFKSIDLPYKGGKVDGEKYFAMEAHMIFKKWGQIFHGGYNLSKGEMAAKMKEAIKDKANTKPQISKRLNIEILDADPSSNAYDLDA